MAKMFIVPPIPSLDALLELISNPTRMSEHLAKLKELMDAVNARLGDLDTHDKAQAFLTRAADFETKAIEAQRRAADTLSKAEADAASILANASAKAFESKASSDERTDALRSHAMELSARESGLRSNSEAVAKREAEVSSREAAVLQRELDLKKREEAIADKVRRVAEAVAG